MKIYQKKYRESYETLYVKSNGNIICECLGNLFNKDREVKSTCRHADDLRKALKSGNMKGWVDVSPKK